MTITKDVGESWTYFLDYMSIYGEWEIECPPDRKVQVGMGISVFGQPRGQKITVVGKGTARTIGVGAIFVRVYDGMGNCTVSVKNKS